MVRGAYPVVARGVPPEVCLYIYRIVVVMSARARDLATYLVT